MKALNQGRPILLACGLLACAVANAVNEDFTVVDANCVRPLMERCGLGGNPGTGVASTPKEWEAPPYSDTSSCLLIAFAPPDNCIRTISPKAFLDHSVAGEAALLGVKEAQKAQVAQLQSVIDSFVGQVNNTNEVLKQLKDQLEEQKKLIKLLQEKK